MMRMMRAIVRALVLCAALILPLAPAAPAQPLRPPGPLVRAASRIRPALVVVWHQRGRRETFGSGFVISREGHILTSGHVVEGLDEVTVAYQSGGFEQNVSAEVVFVDPDLDIGVVKVDDLPLDALALGRGEGLLPGTRIAHYGFPFGRSLDNLVIPSLKAGIISATRPWRLRRGGRRVRVIQLDTTSSKGESGSPVFIAKTGEIIGVLKGHVKGFEDMRNAGGSALEESEVMDLRVVQTSGVGIAVPVDAIRESLLGANIPFEVGQP